MDWHWMIGISITLGIAIAGGIWALVQIVAKVAAKAATIETQLSLVLPVAQDFPMVRQSIAVHEQRIDDHDDEIDKLRDKVHEDANELAALRGKRH